MSSLHRRLLNRRLVRLLPLEAPSLEIGNGKVRRGMDLYPSVTLDHDPARHPDYCCDAHSLPFAQGIFATVVVCETLQYVASPATVLRECRRVLQPDGRLIVSVPSRRGSDHPTDHWRWSWRALGAMVESAGFRVGHLWPVLGIRAWASGYVLEARAA